VPKPRKEKDEKSFFPVEGKNMPFCRKNAGIPGVLTAQKPFAILKA
jgi:hypothetical protein